MSASDEVFKNLRQKLDVFGYTQSLPLSAFSLVENIFSDFVKTTESLRDAKKKIITLLEEKSCWELGVEPYKCDNSRLLAECNELHQKTLREREDYELRLYDLSQKIRCLQSDKLYLEEHCQQLQQQMKLLQSTSAGASMRNAKKAISKSHKPFISTVRSGDLPPLGLLSENVMNTRCTKCNTGYYNRLPTNPATTTNESHPVHQIEKLETNIKDLTEQIVLYKRKVEARDREIRRLNELLTGGRPPAALAKDCCYKDVKVLSEDIELLQREKLESLGKIQQYQDQMHEAMQRAMNLEASNKQLRKELEELKDAALQVEAQANTEIAARECELEAVQLELKTFRLSNEKSGEDKSVRSVGSTSGGDGPGDSLVSCTDKHHINERLNALTQKESELKGDNDRLHKKVLKLKSKISSMQKELQNNAEKKDERLDEEKIRLKSERDFFQKEYLRLVSKSGSEKEVEFLQHQIKSKDEELRILRSELCTRQQCPLPTPTTKPIHSTNVQTNQTACQMSARSAGSSNSSDCVLAAILRVERERDCARAELERIRLERDTLREKHLCNTQMQHEETRKAHQRIEELTDRIKQLQIENRNLNSARLPSETQIVLLKEEMEALKQRLLTLQDENCKLKMSYSQLKILHEQTERSLVEYQNKLVIAESKLDAAELRLSTSDTNRDSTRKELMQLHSEVESLKRTYVDLEGEKDSILAQLDVKTERAAKLECELRNCKEKRSNLENQVKDLEEELEKLRLKTRARNTELCESSAESKDLRQQITALKISRDKAIAENGRLSNDLAESQAEILTLKKKLSNSEAEIDRLKQQLRQYVVEVQKAEDLLLNKEREREEMLEHYRSLSHDAVMLEGNNQSLEVEAAEYKRQITELETEIEGLKKEICCRNGIIQQLEDKISALATQKSCLEHQLEEARDDQRLLRVDLAARKELCEKLDVQKDKLNSELNELNEIRRKLERDNDKLRSDFEKTNSGNKVSSETFEELLTKTRRDLEEQIKVDSKLSQELVRLRQQNEQLLQDRNNERRKREQHETLAHEYQVQNQELRHNLTDDRFRHARSREQSPRFPPQTL